MNTARFRHSSPILLLLTVVLTGSLAAQADSRNDPNPDREVLELRVGSRVRVTTLDGTPPRVGRADTLDPTGLRVRTTEDRTSWIPADAIRRLEVSLERRSFEDRLRPGVVAGGIMGLLGGLITSHVVVEDCSSKVWCFEGLERVLIISAGTFGGAIVGGAISVAAVPGESWAEARLPEGFSTLPGDHPGATRRRSAGHQALDPADSLRTSHGRRP